MLQLEVLNAVCFTYQSRISCLVTRKYHQIEEKSCKSMNLTTWGTSTVFLLGKRVVVIVDSWVRVCLNQV